MLKGNLKFFSFILILLGGGLLIYDMTQSKDLIFLKILGIVLLMMGLYLLNTFVKSKEKEEND